MENVTIRIRDNGPLVITGPVTLVDAEGNPLDCPQDKPALALCRCGASNIKPFCDGSHRGCHFASAPRSSPSSP